MDNLKPRTESGFSPIELLMMVLIIGVLAFIAIPQFSTQRKRGYLKADLRNAASAEEAYFSSPRLIQTAEPLAGHTATARAWRPDLPVRDR